ncbi:hypothetical protein IWQ47_000992 [Aquimarina sp. EL_43]|uniref:hypothetical protein n=1 Tax=Aquimarina TaxID=290174 RepID=UPI00046F7266|nr:MULTISPECIES: hypothetical protein [Aquimarina]MBG6129706.1 hypothetical protein [Aquimarina sp. EL_35]MBG6150771.1 hypothetical protein [Aquimarina sp. EL_32]MBG6167922.1 hypothetical protein [Aquimarina sp. EL_43]
MKHFIYVVSLFVIIGCSGDDDDNPVNPPSNPSGLTGIWHLVNVTGGFSGINDDFEKGVIVWDFDDTKERVEVTNNNAANSSTEDLFPTGIYTFSIVTINGNKELIVNERNLGNFEITTNEFIVDEQFKDGFRYTFQR